MVQRLVAYILVRKLQWSVKVLSSFKIMKQWSTDNSYQIHQLITIRTVLDVWISFRKSFHWSETNTNSVLDLPTMSLIPWMTTRIDEKKTIDFITVCRNCSDSKQKQPDEQITQMVQSILNLSCCFLAFLRRISHRLHTSNCK